MTKLLFGTACILAVLASAMPAAAQSGDTTPTFEAPLSQLDLDSIRGLGAASTGSGVALPNPFASLFAEVAAPFIPGGTILSNVQSNVVTPLQQGLATASNVLKTRHDTVKNAIANIR